MTPTPNSTNVALQTLDENTSNRDLRLLSFEGGAYSLMVGVGETYLAAMVIAVGLGDQAAGLITTVPVLGGACLQLVSFWGVKRFNSNRNWSACSAAVQALSAAAIAIFVLLGWASTWNLFLAATLYWFGGLAAGPSWNTWVEHLVPAKRRATFFGSRSRICQACVLLGILFGGGLLRAFDAILIFAILFGLAAACRFVSAIAIAMGTELPAWRPNKNEPTSLSDIRGCLEPETKTLLGYLLSMQVAVYVSAPFFTPYMLNHLGLSYLQFTWLISLSFVGKILAMPLAGRFAARHGATTALWIGGIGIIPMAGVWILSDSLAFLSVMQILSGVLWAFYELSTMLLFFEKIAPRQRVAALSAYNVGNAAAMVVGSVIGGLLLQSMGATLNAYLVVFLLSSLARVIPSMWMPRRNEATGMLRNLMPAMRLIAVRPQTGPWLRPILLRERAVAFPSQPAEELVIAKSTALPISEEVAKIPFESMPA